MTASVIFAALRSLLGLQTTSDTINLQCFPQIIFRNGA